MQSRNTELLVGLFLLAGIAALVVLALRISGLSMGSTEKGYTLYAHFDNVAGLTDRGKVTLAGVSIGKVKSVEYDRDSFTGKVTMVIDRKVDNLPVDSTASIVTAGLLGEKYISISVGGDDQVLRDEDEIFDTQSSLVLEELIGKFLMNSVNSD